MQWYFGEYDALSSVSIIFSCAELSFGPVRALMVKVEVLCPSHWLKSTKFQSLSTIHSAMNWTETYGHMCDSSVI